MRTKTYTTLLLFLGLALQTLADQCPNHDELPDTCECEDDFVDDEVDVELSCSGSTIEELKDALGLMDKSSRLEVQLDDMNLESLPSRIFDGWNVVKLDISHCELDSLAPQGQVALAGLEDKLEELIIVSSFSEENQPTKIDLSHLNRLKELDLSYNAITEVSNDWFAKGPASLTHLTLSNNGIRKLGDQAFANLVNLEHLELHGNRFGDLKRSMLPGSENKLDHIEFDNNDLTSVPDDLFTDMPDLKVLSIAINRIKHLPEKTFRPIWSQLAVFHANGNPLECDSSMEWVQRVRPEPMAVFGHCRGPEGRNGLDLQKFIDRRG